MSESPSTVEKADRLGRRRARVLPVVAMMLIIQQASYFSNGEGARAVDHVRVGAWAVLSMAVLLLLTTGGAWFRGAEVRALLNDEVTRANRAAALAVGFVCAMLTAIVLFVMRAAWEFSVGEAIHLIVTAGLFSALLRFSFLEKRALG